ncbi:MAG: VWA domain-containing protein [Planctomycetota bacterium]
MPGLPSLLNPWTAGIAAAIAIPALLLLYFLKLRRSPAPVPTTLLWKQSYQDLQVNSPFQRLRRNLLLLLQLLILLALLLALARPVGEGNASLGERSILLIDRSASMKTTDGDGGQTRLDDAKDRARDLVSALGPGDSAMVIAFSDEGNTSPIQPFTQDKKLLRDAIDGIEAVDRQTTAQAAYELADASSSFTAERLRGDDLSTPGVYLFSDGRVLPGSEADLSLRGELTYERVGSPDTENVAVVAASVKRNYERPTEAQAFARLANFGPEPVDAAVRVSVAMPEPGEEPVFQMAGGGVIGVYLPPERWSDPAWREALREADPVAAAEVERRASESPARNGADVQLQLPGSAVVKFEVVQPDGSQIGDALAVDDVAHVVVPPPDPLKVMLVLRDNYWLRLLVESQPIDEPEIVSPAEYEELLATGQADGFDVTVFDNYSPTGLPEAGTFVFSGTLPPADATQITAVTSDAGVPTFFEGSSVLDWDRDHPMLRGLNLNRVWVAEGRLTTLPLGAELLIEGVSGPMMIYERSGRRTHLVFTFDIAQSTWPTQRSFVVFGYQMFQFLAAAGDVRTRESIRPGETLTIPPAAVARSGLSAGDVVTIDSGSDTLSHRVDESGGLTLGPFNSVGLYGTSPELSAFSRVAVSLLSGTESDTRPSVTDPGDRSGRQPTAAAVVGLADGEAVDSRRSVEWWWWLVAGGVAVLMVEWFVYVRRVGR